MPFKYWMPLRAKIGYVSVKTLHQKLPRVGPERELLREKGQFWTPAWVAEAMVRYVIAGGSQSLFDPAVGEGAFFRAAKAVGDELGRDFALFGTEIDPDVLHRAMLSGLSAEDFRGVQSSDFLHHAPSTPYPAIVGNPPYIRHHRVSSAVKAELKAFASGLIGTSLDGRAGIHIYFLLRALQLLAPDGRLAFIMPADTCEGVFAPTLWRWITSRYRLEAVVTFAPNASPFPNVDTNAVVFMIRNAQPTRKILWARCTEAGTDALKQWVASDFNEPPSDAVSAFSRDLTEALATGLSRPPVNEEHTGRILGDFARVVRGIATGANDFFFLTRAQAEEQQIPSEFLVPAIGQTRDVHDEEITLTTIAALDHAGRPTRLFSPDGRPIERFPQSIRDYLRRGEAMGLNRRPLIATRNPWYKMESRTVPPFLFAYLGRRNARFIRNVAGVVPLTGFLCVYPHQCDPDSLRALWAVLQHPETVANLARVGKSYGSGAIKVEPRALERLPLPESVVAAAGLQLTEKLGQLRLELM